MLASGLLASVASILGKLKALGAAGRIGYVAGLSLWTLLCLPTTPIELSAGFIFPLWVSTLMSVAGKTAGSVIALLIGRRLFRPVIVRLIKRSEGGSRTYGHLLRELRERPIQTMGLLRAAPLPTPFKIYGLCLLPEKLVPLHTYFMVALIINSCWSLVWSLTGSSASSVQEALSGGTSSFGTIAAKLTSLGALLYAYVAFSRFANRALSPTSSSTDLQSLDGADDAAEAAEATEGLHRRPSKAPDLAAAG